MIISTWGNGRIMQLPDCAFGRKWPVAEALSITSTATDYVISLDGLPEKCVIWSCWAVNSTTSWGPAEVEFRLGDQLPANLAAFNLLPRLFPSMGGAGNLRSILRTAGMGQSVACPVRTIVDTSGQRLVLRLYNGGTATGIIQAGIVISSAPKTIPDWMVKAYELKESS